MLAPPQPIPLPPVLPLPRTFVIPEAQIRIPSPKELKWEEVPIFVEDLPPPIPTPKPNTNSNTGKDKEKEAEQTKPNTNSNTGKDKEKEAEQTKPEQTEGPNESENKSEIKNDSVPDLDAVPELAEVQTVTIPLVGLEIPLPRTEILVVAATTAGISSITAVAGTLLATTLFRQLQAILKPIFKTIAKKLAKVRKKDPPLSFARQRLKDRYLRQKR